ncbi:MAG: portal protein [Leptospiraceae bacterium]|nr:portal protein [Leptospiraceae bacterium]
MKIFRLRRDLSRSLSALRRLYYTSRSLYHHHLHPFSRWVFFLAGLASGAILIMEIGFGIDQKHRYLATLATEVILVVLVAYEVISLFFARPTVRQHLSEHKLEIGLAGLVIFQWIFRDPLISYLDARGFTSTTAVLLFLAISQGIFVLNNLIHLVRRVQALRFLRVNPAMIFVGSFIFVILCGFALLSLPRFTAAEISFIDRLFIAVSATCVTGLSPVDIARDFTFAGQLVILILIQIGGLGLMTLTSFFSLFLAGGHSISEQLLMRDLLSEDSLGEVRKIVRSVAVFTFAIEGVGALSLYHSLPEGFLGSFENRLFHSIFHSISAFCNAGFSLYKDSLATLSQWHGFSISTFMVLIVLGGLGFPVLRALFLRIIHPASVHYRLSVSTRLVLIATAILLVAGTVAFYFMEQKGRLVGMSAGEAWMHSLFYSITTRTAGFETVSTATLALPTVFFTFLLMWIGASPVSTGGGIKTSTISVATVHIMNLIRGKQQVEVFGRTVSDDTVARAYSTVLLSFFSIFAAIFALLFLESEPFLDIIFEVVSAFGTVGLSRGITSSLSDEGKAVLCLVMFVGRVGSMTFLLAVVPRARPVNYTYPTEYIVVG